MMKFKSTTTDNLNTIPKEDSIIVTTDATTLAYCANNQLHKADKPEWHVVAEPGIWLIRDGVLDTKLAEQYKLTRYNTSSVYQGKDGYVIRNSTYSDVYYRFTVDFTELSTINIAATATGNNPTQVILSNSTLPENAIVSGSVAGTASIDVSKITGTHYLYVYLAWWQHGLTSTTTSLVLS